MHRIAWTCSCSHCLERHGSWDLQRHPVIWFDAGVPFPIWNATEVATYVANRREQQGRTVPPREGQDRHPPGLYILFATEMWERFGFYTAAAIMTLYLQRGGFGWTKPQATTLWSNYLMFVYATPLIGGWLADRFLGYRRSVLVGRAFLHRRIYDARAGIDHDILYRPGSPLCRQRFFQAEYLDHGRQPLSFQ